MSIALPTNLEYGYVTGVFIEAVGDGNDVDRNPDGNAPKGTITFRPGLDWIQDTTGTPPATILPKPVICTLDADGQLLDPRGAVGVYLVANDASTWHYTVDYNITGAPKRSFQIDVPANGTVDLTTASPVAGTQPPIAKGDKGDKGDPGVGITVTGTPLAGAAILSDGTTGASYDTGKPTHQGELVFNVKERGAVGDGTTDDLAIINAAIVDASTALVFGPTQVLLPWTAGGYAASGAVITKSGVRLVGQNRVTLKRVGGTTSVAFVNATGQNNVHVEGFTIDAGGLATATVRASTGTTNMTLKDCKVTNSTGTLPTYGFDTQGSTTDITIEDCLFDNAGSNSIRINLNPVRVRIKKTRITNWRDHAIYVLGTSTNAATDVVIDDVTVDTMGTGSSIRQPIAFEGDETHPITTVRIRAHVTGNGHSYNDTTTPGCADLISLHGVTDFVVSECIVTDGGDVGITISQDCTHGTVSKNISLRNDSVGIDLGASGILASTVSVTGNVCLNNGQNRHADRSDTARAGIRAYTATNCVITGNVFGDDQGTPTQQYGVTFIDCDNVAVGINVDAGNVQGLYLDSSGNTGLEFAAKLSDIPTGSYVSQQRTGTSVSNTTTETTLFTAATIAAADLDATKTLLRFRVSGNFDNAATSGAFTGRLRVNGTLLLAQQIAPSQTNAATGTAWFMDVDLYVDAVGSSGSITLLGGGSMISTATGTVAPRILQALATTVDLSSGLTFTFSGVTATASASNVLRVHRAALNQVA